jgi:hypothetical protein
MRRASDEATYSHAEGGAHILLLLPLAIPAYVHQETVQQEARKYFELLAWRVLS